MYIFICNKLDRIGTQFATVRLDLHSMNIAANPDTFWVR
jgi:hypothetical protein